jgi:uncharacterized protein (DUF433 family)
MAPGTRCGKPCIRGLRITVFEMFEQLAAGMYAGEICSNFCAQTAEDIHACLAFAAVRERRLLTIPAA